MITHTVDSLYHTGHQDTEVVYASEARAVEEELVLLKISYSELDIRGSEQIAALTAEVKGLREALKNIIRVEKWCDNCATVRKIAQQALAGEVKP